jgi:hypothetical protein
VHRWSGPRIPSRPRPTRRRSGGTPGAPGPWPWPEPRGRRRAGARTARRADWLAHRHCSSSRL